MSYTFFSEFNPSLTANERAMLSAALISVLQEHPKVERAIFDVEVETVEEKMGALSHLNMTFTQFVAFASRMDPCITRNEVMRDILMRSEKRMTPFFAGVKILVDLEKVQPPLQIM